MSSLGLFSVVSLYLSVTPVVKEYSIDNNRSDYYFNVFSQKKSASRLRE